MIKKLFLFSLILLAGIPVSYANYSQRQDVQSFIKAFAKESDYTEKELKKLFAGVKKQQRVLEAMDRPAEAKPWYEYKKIFITNKRIMHGVAFLQKYRKELERAEKQYGVPKEIITAIIGIETFYGKNTGSFPVLDTLVSLAFDYPKRARFFRSELKHYLILSKQQGWNHKKVKGSYAGAMGLGQFIASSYRGYAVDFNNDGHIDLFNPIDAIGSVANYFKRHHWHEGEGIVEPLYISDIPPDLYSKKTRKPSLDSQQLKTLGISLLNRDYNGKYAIIALEKSADKKEFWLGQHNFYVITRYNHSNLYAMSAYLLSREIKKRSLVAQK